MIAAGDATSSSASDLNTINEKTTAAINASAITALTSDTIDNIKTLLTAGNDTDQFTETSFASLTGVTVSDETLDGSKLADAIDQANSATGDTSVVFTISAANTIEGSEANFTALLTDDGNNQIDIDDQDISVSGTISVDNANLLDLATTGTITASIDTDETVTELKTLTGTTHAYTIVIAAGDATSSSASDLNTINEKTTEAVDLTNVTALASSSLSDLGTLATAIGNSEFDNATGLTTIAVSDGTVEADVLAARIDSFDTIAGVGETTGMTLASEATINVASGEIAAMLDDEGGRQTYDLRPKYKRRQRNNKCRYCK